TGLLTLALALALAFWRRLGTFGRVLLVASLAIGGGVSLYVGMNADTPPSVFLGLAAFSLVMVLGLLLRAASVLADEREIVENVQATGRRRKELEREKALLLKALKELEFDHEMGKVSDADFREIGGGYRARAMRVLRQLDEQAADYKALVEKELKARLGVAQAAPPDEAPKPAEKSPAV